MKHLTCLLFTLSMTQLLRADLPNYGTFLYIDTNIRPSNLRIPDNPYWEGIPGIIRQDDAWPLGWKFDWIKFKRNITEENPIKVNYIIQRLETNWFGHSYWERMYTDSELLCDTKDLDSNVRDLVRQLLGIPEGCPVLAGDKRKTFGLHFPLNVYHFFLKEETAGHRIRILTTVCTTDGKYTQPLLTGTFYFVYPVGGVYV